ncbi:hypothetical protein SESBI_31377 [Sesbania bispinosa]|nr:hypothetical protein SESBI_31377 [Sesbania bispinosa]
MGPAPIQPILAEKIEAVAHLVLSSAIADLTQSSSALLLHSRCSQFDCTLLVADPRCCMPKKFWWPWCL